MLERSGVIFIYQNSVPATDPPEESIPVIHPIPTQSTSRKIEAIRTSPIHSSDIPMLVPSKEESVSLQETVIPKTPAAPALTPVYVDQVVPDSPLMPHIVPPVPAQQVSADVLTPEFPYVPIIHVPKKDDIVIPTKRSWLSRRTFGIALLLIAITGIVLPILPQIRLEAAYKLGLVEQKTLASLEPTKALPPAVPITFNPLTTANGKQITPVNTDFSIVIPKLGINSAIVGSVNPLNTKEYTAALEKGVAHSSTSYFPNQDGAVYLFSHSTNYAWYVKDLNAVFYNVKNLETGDYIVLFYQGKRYTYQYKDRQIVDPTDTSYLLPISGKKMLILQTCWPPGTTTKRLFIFADLVEEKGV